MKRFNYISVTLVWVLFVAISFFYNREITIKGNKETVLEMSRSFFKVIVNTRAWNASHGGIYTLVTPKNQPNIYLEDSLRDLVTVNGLNLTKINPAYMSRQIFEIAKNDSNIYFHITSLNPIRQLNEADNWEKNALLKFESGKKEVFERVKTDSGTYYRFMAPLFVDKACMKCHAKQGYKPGMVRGGISVNSKANRFDNLVDNQLRTVNIIHISFFILGFISIIAFFRYSDKKLKVIKNLLNVVSASKMEIEEKAEKLMDLNFTKDKFFSIIAHDLMNPVSNFKLIIDLLAKEYENMDNSERKEFIEDTRSSAEQVLVLLQNLLIWSRSQRNMIQFNPSPQNLRIIIENSCKILELQSINKEIKIINEADKNIMVNVDAFMIDTVLRNLISNALKFTYRMGVVHISTVILNEYVEIRIADTGMGIIEEDLNNLFSIDKKVSNRGTEDEPSTGLGLTICKEFVERHGCRIWVESEIGKGSTFYFTLPIIS